MLGTKSLKPGDIIFVRGHFTKITDDLIKLGELIHDHSAEYVHVAIFLGDGVIAEAQGGRLSGTGELAQYKDNYDMGWIYLTDEQRAKLVDEAQQEYGLDYDWHLIGDIAEDVMEDHDTNQPDLPHERICTTYVKSVYKNALGIDFDCGDTPVELSRSNYITMVRHTS